jgi:hypothetical protein
MKKVIRQYSESLTSKDLESYSKTINKHYMKGILFIQLFLIASCSVQNQINKDDYNEIRKIYSGSFYDKLDTITNQYDNRIFTKSFIKDLTNIEHVDYSKPIRVDILKNELFLSYEDKSTKKHVLKFYGERFNKKFVFYTNYQTITFPILFMKKEMTKYSVFLNNNNEIVFDNLNINEGMLLFLGGGRASNSYYKFKLLKNE